MKKPNKHLIKAVTGLTTIGTLGYSCQDSAYMIYEELSDDGLSAITLNLEEDELQYISFLNKLGKDIINSPIIAREFAENPKAFIEKYGYNEKIDLDETFLKLVLALGDEDINSAIRVGDIKLVLMLMNEKGLLDGDSYNKIIISEEQKNEILAQLGVEEADFDKYAACTLVAVCVVLLAVGAVTVAAAVSAAAAAAHVAVYQMTYFWSEGAVNKHDPTKLVNEYSPLKIWGFKGDITSTYVAVDLYLEEQIRDLVDTAEKLDKNAFKRGLDKDQFTQLVKLNILKNSY